MPIVKAVHLTNHTNHLKPIQCWKRIMSHNSNTHTHTHRLTEGTLCCAHTHTHTNTQTTEHGSARGMWQFAKKCEIIAFAIAAWFSLRASTTNQRNVIGTEILGGMEEPPGKWQAQYSVVVPGNVAFVIPRGSEFRKWFSKRMQLSDVSNPGVMANKALMNGYVSFGNDFGIIFSRKILGKIVIFSLKTQTLSHRYLELSLMQTFVHKI